MLANDCQLSFISEASTQNSHEKKKLDVNKITCYDLVPGWYLIALRSRMCQSGLYFTVITP